MNSLTRTNAIAAARQRIANSTRQVPSGVSHIDMAGCGVPINAGGYPGVGDPQGVFQEPAVSAPPQMPGELRWDYIMGVQAQANNNGTSRAIEITPGPGSTFWVTCISSCTPCGQIILNSYVQGGIQFSNVSNVDVGIWDTDQCCCYFKPDGCMSTISPAILTFSPFGTPSVAPFLNIALFGTYSAYAQGCGIPFSQPAAACGRG